MENQKQPKHQQPTNRLHKSADISQIVLAVATVFLSITTVALAFFTYQQAKEVNAQTNNTERLQSAQFMVEFNNELRNGQYSYSHLIAAIDQGSPIFRTRRGKFTEEQIDDYLVMWELLANILAQKLITRDMVYTAFSYDIEAAYQNQEIFCFIQGARSRARSTDLYGGFTEMAEDFLKTDGKTVTAPICK